MQYKEDFKSHPPGSNNKKFERDVTLPEEIGVGFENEIVSEVDAASESDSTSQAEVALEGDMASETVVDSAEVASRVEAATVASVVEVALSAEFPIKIGVFSVFFTFIIAGGISKAGVVSMVGSSDLVSGPVVTS